MGPKKKDKGKKKEEVKAEVTGNVLNRHLVSHSSSVLKLVNSIAFNVSQTRI